VLAVLTADGLVGQLGNDHFHANVDQAVAAGQASPTLAAP